MLRMNKEISEKTLSRPHELSRRLPGFQTAFDGLITSIAASKRVRPLIAPDMDLDLLSPQEELGLAYDFADLSGNGNDIIDSQEEMAMFLMCCVCV